MLIALPILDTETNGRTVLTKQTLSTLLSVVVRPTDRVIVSDNGSCPATLDFYKELCNQYDNFSVIYNDHNLGIAEATNKAWRQALPNEIVVKMDNDCIIKTPGWPELVDYVFSKDDTIGILGLKRKDCAERPDSPEPHYQSKLFYLNQSPGERWIALEEVNHVMGTCYAFNPKMLPKFGYLMQPSDSVYGFDDALAAIRARKLGYKVCFLPQIEIDHIDPPGTISTDPYVSWKQVQANRYMQAYHITKIRIESGKSSPYYGGRNG